MTYNEKEMIAEIKISIKGGQKERAKARSKTFPGIAKAMAEQWEK